MSVKFRCRHNGQCTQLGHGSWSVLLDIGVDQVTRKRQQVRKSGFATRTDAEHAERAMLMDISMQRKFEGWQSDSYYRHACALLEHDVASLDLESGDGDVYVFHAGRYLKIGFSRDVPKREQELRGVRHRSNRPMEADVTQGRVIKCIPGSRQTERLVQHLARNFWVRGEWYVAHPRLIKSLLSVSNDQERLSA